MSEDKISLPAFWNYLLIFLSLKVIEPGFNPIDRVKMFRTGRLQLGRYLLDLCGGDFLEVTFLAVTEKINVNRQIIRLGNC